MPLLGSHLSIAGGMENAVNEAVRLTMDCVQVFTKNQRQWASKPLTEEQLVAWKAAIKAAGWAKEPHRVVSHASYLINLGSPSPELWAKSVASMRVELERCEALGIPGCVVHPGAHLGTPPPKSRAPGTEFTGDERAGLERIVKALNQLARELKGFTVRTLLETTTGSGTNLGGDFEHVAFLRNSASDPDRIGFCLDTCHISSAGYDLSTAKAAKAVLDHFDDICGLEHLKAVHLNDSKAPRGSRIDRHEHILHGTCGRPCFEAVLRHKSLQKIPMVLETAKEKDSDGREWDAVNLEVLRSLAGSNRSSSQAATQGPRHSQDHPRKDRPRGRTSPKR